MMIDSALFMAAAMQKARAGRQLNEVPVGAVLVCGGQIVAASHNAVETTSDPVAHAEILVLRAGAQLIHSRYLSDCDLYVTLEPCPMCFYAASLARIRRIYFGAYDERNGAAISCKLNVHGHRPECYGGIEERECSRLVSSFFESKRR